MLITDDSTHAHKHAHAEPRKYVAVYLRERTPLATRRWPPPNPQGHPQFQRFQRFRRLKVRRTMAIRGGCLSKLAVYGMVFGAGHADLRLLLVLTQI